MEEQATSSSTRVYAVEESPFGRVVVPAGVPQAYALFYTTRDFPGRLNTEIAGGIVRFVRDRFGPSAALTTCNQVHGTTVQRATSGSKWNECDSCDALWSSEPGTALGIKVADCLPVTVIDPDGRVVANIHSGWRGAARGVTAATIETLRKGTSFTPSRAKAWLGPSIRVCCFEVGEEVVSELAAFCGEESSWVDRTRTKPHVDLVTITRQFLQSAGFGSEKIIDTGICTRCEGSIFHSFRRDRTTGRNLAIVAQ